MLRVFFLLAPLFLAAPTISVTTPESESKIKIGMILPLTGPASHLGESDKRGATIAADLINETGGISGSHLSLAIEDSRSEPSAGVSAYRKLTGVDKVSAVLATLTSVSMALGPLAESQRVVLFAESSHPNLVQGKKFTFRHFFTGESAAPAVAAFVKKHNFRKIAILHAAEEFGESAATSFEETLKDPGFAIIARERFLKDDIDLRAQLLRIKAGNPDFIYLIGVGSPFSAAIRQAKNLGISTPVLGYILCGQSQILESVKDKIEGMYSVDPIIAESSAAYKALAARHARDFPKDKIDQSTIATYDAVNILAEAYASGAKSGEEIRNYLTSKLQYSGAMGKATFDQSPDSVVPMTILKVKDGSCVAAN